MDRFILAIVCLIIGFGAGYSVRSYISRRRRSQARELYRQQPETLSQIDQPVAVDENDLTERDSGHLDERDSTRLNRLLELAGSVRRHPPQR